jgi:hypothetical protein
MATHAQAQTGTGNTTARAISQIGSDITLPAGGPWTIFGIWGQVAKITTVPNEGTGGELIFRALSGDLTPDPAPGIYPMVGTAGSSSVNMYNAQFGLNIWPVNWSAAGKSVISLSYRQQLAITSASITAGGILFGDTVPPVRPLKFCDSVQASFASAAEQTIGTITLAEKATRIVGVMADLNKGDATTAAEPMLATVRLASDDVKMPPFVFPCARGFNAADGTAVGGPSSGMQPFIPVDIPVVGGARIDIFATSTQSITGNIDLAVYLAYE